ncbi:MAG: Ig-like domain-containing protein, partial [Planctomycetota bacterium]|nr:Ig-like domain-containing protein [Planctomycetota bacterium]
VSGSGVTLSKTTYVSATTYRVTATAALTAALGDRDLTYEQAAVGGGAKATLTKAFQVQPAVTPNRWRAGESRFTIEILGSSFDSGSKVSVSGSGVTVHSTTFVSKSALTAELSVAMDATIGARDITVTPGTGSAQTYKGVARIIPAPPTVLAFDPVTLAQNASSISATVTGTGFRSGTTLDASGEGITISNVSVVSAETITATFAATKTAKLGARDLTVTFSTGDGGASATLKAAFQVVVAAPKITSVFPATLGRTGSGGPTRTFPIRITGSGFATGATLAVSKTSGSGVTVVTGSEIVVSDTTLVAAVSITGTASTGKWDLKITNPGNVGNSGTSGNALLDIKSETTLTVNRITPDTGSAHGGERVTIYGSGFPTQAIVDFGTIRASGTQVLDRNTLVATVPPPGSASTTGTTSVDVKVGTATGTPATLKNGYTYGRDTVELVILKSFPADGATGVAHNLVSGAVLLAAPADTTTAKYGTTAGTNCRWFEAGGNAVSNGLRGFGPRARWLVFSRTGGGNLPKNNAGKYILETPTTLESIGGVALTPVKLSSTGDKDQHSFTISTSTSDTTAPKVATITPGDTTTGQDPMTTVLLKFDEEIDPLTVSTANITFQQGSTTVGASIGISDDLKTVTIIPHAKLSASTKYTTTVTASVKDFYGNAFAKKSYTFTTSGSDTTAPVIDTVTIAHLPPDLDGSGTYVDTAGTSGQAFDAFLARGGWLVHVTYSDAGGSGVDETTFSAKASVKVGNTSANTELASGFAVTSIDATWRVPDVGLATGENITLTFLIKDKAATPNTSSSKVVTIDIFDLAANASKGGLLDPFDKRDSWVLRGDLDHYTASFKTTSSPNQQGATTTLNSNGVLDLDESLRLVGLNSGNMKSAAAATVNGNLRGTNAILRRMFLERLREIMRERFGIAEDGTRDRDSVNIEFLLPGEMGSLSAFPTLSTKRSLSTGNAWSEISIGGTKGAESSAYQGGNVLGAAWFDKRNRLSESDINNDGVVGVFLLGMLKLQVNRSSTELFNKVSKKLVTIHGGTPAGEDASDDDVLAGTFDRSSSSNTTHNARYDTVMDGLEVVALYTASVLAHEVGHSIGLCADGAPKTGLFGNAHHTNTFTSATSTNKNTSAHMRYIENNIMSATLSLPDALRTGADVQRFAPLPWAYLLRRGGYDEGK